MDIVREFFNNIDRSDVDASMQNLVSDGIIDSLDIIGLVSQIEKHYQRSLDAQFIEASNFESFESISNMIKEAMR